VGPTFIIDCPKCEAKVACDVKGILDNQHYDSEASEPYGHRLAMGSCPSCGTSLVGRAEQTDFEGWEGSEHDRYGDYVRVYPKPPKTFSSNRIPRALTQSLLEAERSLQAGASIAACVMLGRSLEALCRDVLERDKDADGNNNEKPKRRVMLAAGIEQLREKKVIDDRLYNWSQDLNAFRNLAAHPEDITISRQDADDLQAFVYAITEYVYDLSDRYKEFKERLEESKKPRKSVAEMFGSVKM
jgi:Domain of unknown function (DUF4145)